MSLDDRLRGAYRRQLEDVERGLEHRPVTPIADGGSRGPTGRVLAIAAVVALLAATPLVLNRVLSDTGTGTIETDAGSSTDDSAVADTTSPTVVEPTTSTARTGSTDGPASTESTAALGSPATGGSTTGSADRPDRTTASTTAVATATTAIVDGGSTTETTVAASQPSPVGGVANDVCPTGSRAELEWSALAYVGENRGWGRKDDLVDEQEGPFYFEAWEPNYELPVSVEVTLRDPVSAVDIRVAQDPFTPVAGSIGIEIAGETVEIELSGTEGWRTHRFANPVVVERFTITRTERRANIMEVLLCVEPTP